MTAALAPNDAAATGAGWGIGGTCSGDGRVTRSWSSAAAAPSAGCSTGAPGWTDARSPLAG